MSYEKVYQNLGNYDWSAPESLAKFLRQEVFDHPRVGTVQTVLELGCGLGSVFESPELSHLQIQPLCLDISASAIERAQQRQAPGTYQVADVTDPKLFLTSMFDLIIDAHLFHCLVRPSMREAYLANVIKHLKPETGIFVLETMVAHKRMDVPGMDHTTGVIGGEYGRKVFHHLELEQELLKSGLKIEFLIFTSGLNMVPVADRSEALPTDPQIARALCSFSP